MISFRDYAKDAGISYEAVRKKVMQYRGELEGHVHQQGRTKYLDDVAVAFLNEHRSQAPAVLYEAGRDQDLIALRKENDELKDKLIKAFEAMQEQQAMLIEAKAAQLMLESAENKAEKAAQEASEARERVITLEKEKDVLQAEIEALKKRSWWDVPTGKGM